MTEHSGGRLSKFFAAFLLTSLVLSFALWGVGDVFRRGLGGSEAAKISGGPDISMHEYEQALRTEVRRLEMQTGRPITEDILKAMHVPQQVISVLVNQKLLKQEATRLGLAIGDTEVVKAIRSDERFLNKEGTFDRPQFDRLMAMYGYSESQYVGMVRDDMERQLLTAALASHPPVVKAQIDALYKMREERRGASVLALKESDVKNVPEPSDADLKKYYEAQKALFSTLETRTVTYLTVSTQDVAQELDLSDAALKAEYEQRRDEFVAPEKRTLTQLLIQDEAKAKQVAALLQKKPDLKEAAKQAGITDKPSEIGVFTQAELAGAGIFEESAVKDIFALGKGKAGGPYKSPLGWHIVEASSVDKPKEQGFEDVKEKVKQALLKEKGADLLYELTNRIEDKIAGGATLEEAAKSQNLKSVQVKDLTGAGRAGLPGFGNFLQQAFEVEEGAHSGFVPNEDNSAYYIVQVDSVALPQPKKFEEVRPEVLKAWQQAERKKLLAQLATDTAKRVREGKVTLEQAGSTVTKLSSIRRDYAEDETLTADAVKALFALEKGKTTDALPRGDAYIILRADSIVPPEDKDRSMAEAAIAGELEHSFEQDVQQQLIIHLRTLHPVKQYIEE